MSAAAPAVEASKIAVRLGGRRVLAEADFAVRGGELVGLVGPNGAGKTTLLRVLAGLLAAEGGELRLDGQPAAEVSRRERARRIAYLPQGGVCHWPLTVEAVVGLGRLPHLGPWRGPSARDRAAVRRAMEATDITGLAGRPVTALSGGERARVLLARALAVEPRVLLADEPIAGLDPYHALEVMEQLRGLAEDGTAVVAVLHDLTLAARFCHRLVLLHRGRVVAEGGAADVLCPEHLARAYRVRAEYGRVGPSPYVLPWDRLSAQGEDRAS